MTTIDRNVTVSSQWAKIAFRVLIGFTLPALAVEAAESNAPSYSREVLPILARNCFPCHGPDTESREADLQLDVREQAVEYAIDLDDPSQSPVIERIHADDEDLVMPPPESGKSLTDSEKELLLRWIQSGANYESHWAFAPPRSPSIPEAASAWGNNPIDAFLLHSMKQAGLKPSPRADRYTLVKRLYLDLIGLLPTPEEADEFVNDKSEDAYEKLVNRLLASRHYGERWARPWLDLARYADTNGYEKDRPRSIWPYRDWVIQALNDDMPFDQFTVEQLAGDMLPDATIDQRVATGFHRNTMLNEEGGIDPLEYRFYAMVDRVATTGTVWMGLTIGCAQCHSHKYDPISHTDYYRFMALLNNADEPDLPLPPRNSQDTSNLDNREKVDRRIVSLVEAARQAYRPNEESDTESGAEAFDQQLQDWIRDRQQHLAEWTIARPVDFESNLPRLERLADNSIYTSGDFTKRDTFSMRLELPALQTVTAIRLEALPDDRLPAGGPGRAYYEGRKGDFFLSEIDITVNDQQLSFSGSSRSYGRIAIGSGNADASNVYDDEGSTGWSTANREGERHTLVLNLAEPIETDELRVDMLFERHFVAALGRFRFSVTSDEGEIHALDLDEELEAILRQPPATWTESQQHAVRIAFVEGSGRFPDLKKKIASLRKSPTTSHTLVMHERPADNPRKTWRHHRGEWLSKREEVTGAVPAIFPPLPEGVPADRLTLARWLASERNPLVGRVVVNRAWRQLMGDGLMRSDGDFGTQSAPPTHPELLDWLACSFADDWSMKELHRKIVSSAAYQQQSIMTPTLQNKDPENRFFARGPRHRVEAEMVRDILLCGTGKLVHKLGGPSVFPPQPASVTATAYGSTKWNVSKGDDRYRRSLYTFSKRTAPFAAFTTFDAPTGENCVARRNRSNTPLQSLTLLNDQMYVELAYALGRDTAIQFEDDQVASAITHMFRRLLIRPPRQPELDRLLAYYTTQLERFQKTELSASEMMGDADVANETAALSMVARVLMNLDEVIAKY